ncbi:MAG: hypothetical protein ACKPBB_11345 [Sphaerospermopsis kisseleviana]
MVDYISSQTRTGDFNMAYDPESQARYNSTEKGKARKRKWAENMTPEQKEKQRIAKRDYMRRKRAKEKEQ